MPNEEHIQRIIKWRESFTLLPENHFFELMRMYLGNVKTPFSKPKLVEELGAFIRNPATKKTMISLLSENDVKILNGIYFIENTTQESLAQFFEGEYSFPNLYERLLNLEERLLIYRFSDKVTHKTIIDINPMIEEELKPFLDLDFVLTRPKKLEKTGASGPLLRQGSAQAGSGTAGRDAEALEALGGVLTPELIAGLVNYIESDPSLCKNDGSLKKRAVEELEKIFPKKGFAISALLKAFINLSLIREDDDGFFVDRKRFESFAELPAVVQVLYLCVSSSGRFGREWLLKQSELLYKNAIAIPSFGYSKRILMRASYVAGLKDGDETSAAPTSRFSAILAQARGEGTENFSPENFSSGAIIDRLSEAAEAFGILEKIGTDEKGEPVYVTGKIFEQKYNDDAKVLSIDSGYNVTVMPGLSLKATLPLTSFMKIISADTATTYEINRKSVMDALDKGMTFEKIISTLEKHSLYEIPQNLKISIKDWASTFSSASIYKGFVLQVSEENSVLAEKNPEIAPHIKKVLAPGTFLLEFKDDGEMKRTIEKSGLDFIGNVKSEHDFIPASPFPKLDLSITLDTSRASVSGVSSVAEPVEAPTDEDKELPTSKQQYKEARDTIIANLKEHLAKMSLIPEQREELLSRLNRKIIITPEQFRPDSVRLERVEAAGIDYHGKIMIIEHAIESRSLVEIEYDEIVDGKKGEAKTIVATPISITKLADDAEVTLSMEPYNNEFRLSIGRARRIKRVRGDVLD